MEEFVDCQTSRMFGLLTRVTPRGEVPTIKSKPCHPRALD